MSTSINYVGVLIAAVPMLLVYLAGVIASLMFWSRWPRACSLMFAGALLLLLTSLGAPVVQAIIIQRAGTASAIGSSIMMFGLATSVIRAAGTGLMIWAAFAERPIPVASAFETLPPRQ